MSRALEHDLREKGAVRIDGVFSPVEIGQLRCVAERHFATRPYRHNNLGCHQPDAAGTVPELQWVFEDPRVIALFRRGIGHDEIVFTGQSDLASNRLSGWHKDSDGICSDEDLILAAEDFKVLKLVVYLQDHDDEDDCFRYYEGSHRCHEALKTKPRTISTRAGDVILFDVRLTHAGRLADPFELLVHRGAKVLYPGYPRHDRYPASIRQSYRRIRHRQDRHGLFFSFGPDNAWTEGFSRVNLSRQYRYNRLVGLKESSDHRARVAAALEARGVRSNLARPEFVDHD